MMLAFGSGGSATIRLQNSRLNRLQMLTSHRDRPMRRRVLVAVIAPGVE
jgi:hypothetical protein